MSLDDVLGQVHDDLWDIDDGNDEFSSEDSSDENGTTFGVQTYITTQSLCVQGSDTGCHKSGFLDFSRNHGNSNFGKNSVKIKYKPYTSTTKKSSL